jgi:hypothetical protein
LIEKMTARTATSTMTRTRTRTTMVLSDIVLDEETAVSTLLTPEAALVPVAEPRRSGRERKAVMTTKTTVAAARRMISPETVPNDVMMPEETAVVNIPAPEAALVAETIPLPRSGRKRKTDTTTTTVAAAARTARTMATTTTLTTTDVVMP